MHYLIGTTSKHGCIIYYYTVWDIADSDDGHGKLEIPAAASQKKKKKICFYFKKTIIVLFVLFM